MSDPTIKYSLAKYLDKGEDAWTQQPAATLALDGSQGACLSESVCSRIHQINQQTSKTDASSRSCL